MTKKVINEEIFYSLYGGTTVAPIGSANFEMINNILDMKQDLTQNGGTTDELSTFQAASRNYAGTSPVLAYDGTAPLQQTNAAYSPEEVVLGGTEQVGSNSNLIYDLPISNPVGTGQMVDGEAVQEGVNKSHPPEGRTNTTHTQATNTYAAESIGTTSSNIASPAPAVLSNNAAHKAEQSGRLEQVLDNFDISEAEMVVDCLTEEQSKFAVTVSEDGFQHSAGEYAIMVAYLDKMLVLELSEVLEHDDSLLMLEYITDSLFNVFVDIADAADVKLIPDVAEYVCNKMHTAAIEHKRNKKGRSMVEEKRASLRGSKSLMRESSEDYGKGVDWGTYADEVRKYDPELYEMGIDAVNFVRGIGYPDAEISLDPNVSLPETRIILNADIDDEARDKVFMQFQRKFPLLTSGKGGVKVDDYKDSAWVRKLRGVSESKRTRAGKLAEAGLTKDAQHFINSWGSVFADYKSKRKYKDKVVYTLGRFWKVIVYYDGFIPVRLEIRERDKVMGDTSNVKVIETVTDVIEELKPTNNERDIADNQNKITELLLDAGFFGGVSESKRTCAGKLAEATEEANNILSNEALRNVVQVIASNSSAYGEDFEFLSPDEIANIARDVGVSDIGYNEVTAIHNNIENLVAMVDEGLVPIVAEPATEVVKQDADAAGLVAKGVAVESLTKRGRAVRGAVLAEAEDGILNAIFDANEKSGKIQTDFGAKTKEGLRAMLANLSYEPSEVADAIFYANSKRGKMSTLYGDKTLQGITAMVNNYRESLNVSMLAEADKNKTVAGWAKELGVPYKDVHKFWLKAEKEADSSLPEKRYWAEVNMIAQKMIGAHYGEFKKRHPVKESLVKRTRAGKLAESAPRITASKQAGRVTLLAESLGCLEVELKNTVSIKGGVDLLAGLLDMAGLIGDDFYMLPDMDTGLADTAALSVDGEIYMAELPFADDVISALVAGDEVAFDLVADAGVALAALEGLTPTEAQAVGVLGL